jgi:CHAT domain-containing protein/tetratricopeptide (TPR) repeat protein
MRKSTVLIMISFAFYLSAQGQNPGATSSSKADDVLEAAKKIYSEDGPSKALPEYERALSLFQKEGNRKGEAITIGLMGNAYKNLGQPVKALEFLQRALAMKREIGDRLEEGKTLSNLGLFYWHTVNDYPKALDYYNQASVVAKELGNKTLEAAIHNNTGLVYDEIGDVRALDEYKRAIELYGSEATAGLTDAVGNLGGWHLLHGNYAEALTYYQRALAVDEQLKSKRSISLDLQNIGLCLVGLGKSEDSIHQLDRSIALAHEAGFVKEEADSRKAKASALLQLGRYTDALQQYNLAIQVYQQAGLNGEAEFKQNLVEALGDLGNLEMRLGDVASAEKDFRRAIDLAEEIKHPRGVTVNLISLGDVQFRQKRFSEAAALYNQALSRANSAEDKGNAALARVQLSHDYRNLKKLDEAELQARQAMQTAKETQAKPLEADAVYALAEVQRERALYNDALNTFTQGSAIATDIANPELSWRFDFGKGETLQSLNRNSEALAAYQNAVKTIETVRTELREERFRAGYIEDKYQVYVALVQLLLKLNRVEEAFLVAERLRARSYLDMINRGAPPIRNQAQREKESTLRSRIRDLQKRLEEENAKPGPDQKRLTDQIYSKELTAAESDYESFLDDLSASEPTYAAVRSLKVPSGNEVRKELTADTALIEYVLSDQELVVFVITAEGLHAKAIPVRSTDIQSRVETLRDLMLRNTTTEWQLPAAALYRELIAPIENESWLKGKTHLYVIPHSILHYVPFAALLKKNRPLINDYVIAYLPAAAALVQKNGTNPSSSSILAMAPASSQLHYTQLESESVSNFFPKQHTLLLGARATESSFKKLAGQFDLIHLATHGYFNKTNPLLSGLTLESDAIDDGRLEVHEIMGLRLNAKLVTLSACDTAVASGYFSDVPPGDDLVGLTRAFLSTGTTSVAASLWAINDRSAVNFMNRFYRQLQQKDKATALADAQRQMILSGRYRHPYYWAAFVMVGRM